MPEPQDPLIQWFADFRDAVNHAAPRPPVAAVVRRTQHSRRARGIAVVSTVAATVVVVMVAVLAVTAPVHRPVVGTSPPVPTATPTPTAPSSTAPSSSGPSSAAVPSSSDAPSQPAHSSRPEVVACTTAALDVSIGPSSSAKFEEGAPVTFTNRGHRACTLAGYPRLVFRRSGTTMPITVHHATAPPARTVTLKPGQSTSAQVTWYKYDSQGATCPPFATEVSVTPPGQTTATTVPWLTDPESASICGGSVTVSAVG